MSNRSNGQQQQQQEQRSSNRPIHVVRYEMVKVAVWRNVVDIGNASTAKYNVTAVRLYKDGDEWRDTQSFGYGDLLCLAKALNDAHTWIAEQLIRDRESEQQDAPEQQQERRPQQVRQNGSRRDH